jgi:hypothetical protein
MLMSDDEGGIDWNEVHDMLEEQRNGRAACCKEPKVRGGRCDNCGKWLADDDYED